MSALRVRILICLLSGGPLCALSCGPGQSAPATAEQGDQATPGVAPELLDTQPNVLFLVVDDLRDWVGFLGDEQARTPHLDALAKQSTVFERAYCPAPICNPCRAAVLTGVRPEVSGIYANKQDWRLAMPEAITLPDSFRAAGYETVGMGKIFHPPWDDPSSWDRYVPLPREVVPLDHPKNGLKDKRHFDWGPVPESRAEMADWKVAEAAEEFLVGEHEAPFFLAVGIYRPHLPWYLPEEYFARHPLTEVQRPPVRADDLADLPPPGLALALDRDDHSQVLEAEQWERALQAYRASISFADECVGRVLRALHASGEMDNTIIVVWGDHGWHLGEKQHWRKFALWEVTTRVPLLVRAPGFKPGRSSAAVNLMDLYPTLLELSGVERPVEGTGEATSSPALAGLAGQSLVPLLRDPSGGAGRVSITTHGPGNHAVRQGPWRLIRYADGSEELYDHREDPNEWDNLARDPRFADKRAELAPHLPGTSAEPF